MDLPALLAPFVTGLTSAQLAQVSTYLDLLTRWNSKMNLTSIRDPQKIVSRHFGESFFLAKALTDFVITSGRQSARDLLLPGAPSSPSFGEGGMRNDQAATEPLGKSQPPITNDQFQILDVGSGAGFPAIPLKIYRPDITITLIEANHRKAVFLREVLRALSLDAEVKNVRAEDLPPASADLVTLRAVEQFESILPIAARLVRPAEPDTCVGRTFLSVNEINHRVPGPFPPLERAGMRSTETLPVPTSHPENERSEYEGSMHSDTIETPVHGSPSAVHGLSLLIGSAQIASAKKILPNWRFHPEIHIPNSQNRVIQLIEPN